MITFWTLRTLPRLARSTLGWQNERLHDNAPPRRRVGAQEAAGGLAKNSRASFSGTKNGGSGGVPTHPLYNKGASEKLGHWPGVRLAPGQG